MDFRVQRYRLIINTFKKSGYSFLTFADFIKTSPNGRFVILRHDIDCCPKSALAMARIDHELEVRSTFYFRAARTVLRPEIIKKIAELGHEIGYHYEDLARAHGDYDRALDSFKRNLD